jgi:trans-aconitate 2-methyltransferase
VLRGGAAGAEPVASVAQYAEVLHAAGCRVEAWEITYRHVLDVEGAYGDDVVLAWVGGTALRPLLAGLHDDVEREAFTQDYAERLRVAYPRRPYGTPFEFRRIFVVART